jgi:N-acetylmuramoyl-L-alanine amidase CwlA
MKYLNKIEKVFSCDSVSRMNPLTEPKPTMSKMFLRMINSPKTSVDTCMVEFQNTHLKFYTMEKRPIYDTSKEYRLPKSYTDDYNIVTVWYDDRVVRQYNIEGIMKTWYNRPTIKDVVNGRFRNGCCVKFNSDGSIYMNWGDFSWYHGPLINGFFEDIEDSEDDDTSHQGCECMYGEGMWN